MDGRIKKILEPLMAFGFLAMLFVSGCGKKEAAAPAAVSGEKITEFCFQQFSDRMILTVTGESAEMSPAKDAGTIKEPAFSLKSENDLIEITTGDNGTADIRMDRGGQKMGEAVLQGDVKIVRKDKKTGLITMEARCRKLTYSGRQETFVMEGNPIITQGKNSWSGDKITYYWNENRAKTEGKVHVVFYPEKNPAP